MLTISCHLNKVTERHLVTNEMKKKLNLRTIKLKITIEEENYLKCKKVLKECSGEHKMHFCVQCYVNSTR